MSESLLPYVDVNPDGQHDAVVIWLHGLGDSGNGFAPIVPELRLPEQARIRFVFPHAPVRPVTINNGMQMRAWYDIKSLDFNQRADLEGVEESAAQVLALLEKEIEQGIGPERIVLAGFSQGGVIALHLAARLNIKLAGFMALSTYLCAPEQLQHDAVDINKDTPILFGHGSHDEVVPKFLGHAAFKTLEENGFNVTWKDYPMQHNVCMEEIQDISAWLQKQLPLL